MSEQTGNIYQKLAKVRKQVEVIRKNKSGYGYKYVTEDEILAKISVFMDKYHLSLVPSMRLFRWATRSLQVVQTIICSCLT